MISRAELKTNAKSVLSRNYGMALVAVLIASAISGAVTSITNPSRTSGYLRLYRPGYLKVISKT